MERDRIEKNLKILEYDKILGLLALRTSCDDSRELALKVRPAYGLDEAELELTRCSDAHSLMAKYSKPSFGSLTDVRPKLAHAAAGGSLSMGDLLRVAEVVRVIRSLYEWRFSQPGAESSLDMYFDTLVPQRDIEDRIMSSVIDENTMSDRASPALADIRRKKKNAEASVRTRLEHIIRSQDDKQYLQDAIITQRNGRYVVPVKSEFRAYVKGLVHDTSGSGATVFIEPISVVEANNEICVLEGKEKAEIERILSEISAQVGVFADTIGRNYESLLELDLCFAKAALAYEMDAVVPELNADGIVRIIGARHPLLDKEKVVPIDLILGGDYDTLVITGPNTGGKTVSLKTLGLITLMAQSGFMIPAAVGSKVAVFGSVEADIGDEQSIEQSLSTFSAHMTNIISILDTADEKSLVLIDELGAGTDPVEGAALATAILEKLRSKGATVAATTHYAELKAYALQTPGVENACCEFDVETLRPTYRLLIGAPGKSNAFAISLRLGLDPDIIEHARRFISGEDSSFSSLLDSLESRRRELERARDETEQALENARVQEQKAREKLAQAEAVLQKQLEDAKKEALRVTENARRQANALIFETDRLRKELKDAAQKETAAQVTRRAAEIKASLRREIDDIADAAQPSLLASADDDYVLPRDVKKGDRVFVPSLGQEADVLSDADSKGMTQILAGSLKMRVDQKTLRLIEKKDKEKKTDLSFKKDRLNASGSTRCDIRGMTTDEGLFVLAKFIDDMRTTGIKEFTVIHGKGTGALRAAVQRYLKGEKCVASFRNGVYGEGEMGVTIVTLK